MDVDSILKRLEGASLRDVVACLVEHLEYANSLTGDPEYSEEALIYLHGYVKGLTMSLQALYPLIKNGEKL